ncbi:MAG: DUF1194 domain-containing protein [Magnetovibrio sp.]|nr:DUF1194 domain-containing protein [Magnetovibrio sp.]
MKGFVAIFLAMFLAAPLTAAAGEPVDLELVLAADGSGSIDDEELKLQRDGYAAALTHPRVLEAMTRGYRGAIALAFVEWGGPHSQHTIVDWMKIDGRAAAERFAAKLRAAPRAAESYNSISEAIAYSADLIATNAFDGQRRIIDISGDGPQINGRPLPAAKALAMAQGITINALVINSPGGGYPGPRGEPLDEHYRNDVIGGRGAFVIVAEGRQGFAKAILRKLILEIADRDDVSGL